MARNAEAWRKANPDAEALIQFNFPPKVAVIAPISEAVRLKVVVTNDHGLSLLKALWPWEDRYEPTVLMCRAVLES